MINERFQITLPSQALHIMELIDAYELILDKMDIDDDYREETEERIEELNGYLAEWEG